MLLGLGLAETLVRVLDLGPTFQVVHREIFRLSDDPLLGYELKPGARAGPLQINADGLRDRDYPRAKPPGVFRIAALGDSVTFGALDAAESYPKQLERLLNACSTGPRFEVLNFGVMGYNALQVAERLRVSGLAYAPDLVLYGYVLNDPQERSVEAEALATLREAESRRFAAEVGRGALRWCASSRLFLLVAHRLRGSAERPPAAATGHLQDPGYIAFQRGDARGAYFRALHEDPAALRLFHAGFDRLARAADEARVPVVVAIFPLFLKLRGDYPLAGVHDFVAAEARARGFEPVDLEPRFAAVAGRLDCAADFLHPNALGNRVAAATILERLAALGRLPAGSVDLERLAETLEALK